MPSPPRVLWPLPCHLQSITLKPVYIASDVEPKQEVEVRATDLVILSVSGSHFFSRPRSWRPLPGLHGSPDLRAAQSPRPCTFPLPRAVPGRVPLHPRPLRQHVHRPALDRSPVRRLQHCRGVQCLLQGAVRWGCAGGGRGGAVPVAITASPARGRSLSTPFHVLLRVGLAGSRPGHLRSALRGQRCRRAHQLLLPRPSLPPPLPQTPHKRTQSLPCSATWRPGSRA